MKEKNRFLAICKHEIEREGVEDLLAWLETTDFFTAPASTKYHNSYEGGLCKHSLNVYDRLCKLNLEHKVYGSNNTSIAIVSLFHDICKANFYKVSMRNTKNENGEWVKVPFYEIDDQQPFGYHADKSVILLQRFIRLTDDEIYAIRGHSGGFDTADNLCNKIFEKSKLALLLHFADMTATYIDEVENG